MVPSIIIRLAANLPFNCKNIQFANGVQILLDSQQGTSPAGNPFNINKLLKNLISFFRTPAAVAVGFLFATSSLLFGTWVASIPAVKLRLGLTDGTLGLSLLLSPLGALTGMAFSGRVFSRIPVGRWMMTGYLLLACMMVLLVNSVNIQMLWICLYGFGIISFLNGVSANATVNLLEGQYKRSMMSTCHGMYSLGGAVSAGIAAALFAIGVPGKWQILFVALVVSTIIIANRKWLLLHDKIIHSRSGLKLPNKSILGLSFICMTSFMAEGCVADWSAIYLQDSLQSPKALISLGYAGFSIAMTLGRLNGDTLIERVGKRKLVVGGCLLSALGFAIVVAAGMPFIAIAGYVLIGLGCCCTVPVVFSASANIPGVSTVEGFAMVTTGGLIGFLTGPSIIGFIAEASTLATGLSFIIVMSLLSALVAYRSSFLKHKAAISQVNYDEQIY